MSCRQFAEPESARDCLHNADNGATTLSEVFTPKALAEHLRLFAETHWNWEGVEEIKVGLLRCKAHRCTAEVNLRCNNGWHSLIGKVYAIDRPDVFQAMERIRLAGFGAQDEFSIPQPLAYVPTLRLLLQEKVEGQRAKEIFTTGDEWSCTATAERCARWLARFHATAPKAGPILEPCEYFSSDEMSEKKQRWLRTLAESGGRVADKAARLLGALEDAASTLRPVEMCAGHGSYSASHVIPANGRTVVIDWDGYDVADPARDLGRFLAALRHCALGRLGSIRALDAMAEVFLNTYLDVGEPEAARNLRFYEAGASLALAKHAYFHGRLEKMEATLDEGLRVLEGKGATETPQANRLRPSKQRHPQPNDP